MEASACKAALVLSEENNILLGLMLLALTGCCLVFFRPPPQHPFPHMSLDTVWFGRVMLLFKVRIMTDSDLQQGDVATEFEIAMLEVMSVLNDT